MMTVSAPPVVPASLKLMQESLRLELGEKFNLNDRLRNCHKSLINNILL
jgi:hypothetical protein